MGVQESFVFELTLVLSGPCSAADLFDGSGCVRRRTSLLACLCSSLERPLFSMRGCEMCDIVKRYSTDRIMSTGVSVSKRIMSQHLKKEGGHDLAIFCQFSKFKRKTQSAQSS